MRPRFDVSDMNSLMRAMTRDEVPPSLLAVGVAERAVALVDDDDDLADRLDHGQDLLEVALGGADPLGAEVLQLDRREAALLRERLGDERLAGAHRAGEEDAHRHAARAALADVLGDHEEVLLDLLHAADDLEAVLRLDELDEAEALALEDLALAPRDEPVGLPARPLGDVRGVPSGARAPGAMSFRISSRVMPAVKRGELLGALGDVRAAAEDRRDELPRARRRPLRPAAAAPGSTRSGSP